VALERRRSTRSAVPPAGRGGVGFCRCPQARRCRSRSRCVTSAQARHAGRRPLGSLSSGRPNERLKQRSSRCVFPAGATPLPTFCATNARTKRVHQLGNPRVSDIQRGQTGSSALLGFLALTRPQEPSLSGPGIPGQAGVDWVEWQLSGCRSPGEIPPAGRSESRSAARSPVHRPGVAMRACGGSVERRSTGTEALRFES
jgi:hypothetical protein